MQRTLPWGLLLVCALGAIALIAPDVAKATTAGTVAPDPIGFGNVQLGTSASQDATITNTGDGDEIVSISVTGSADFSVTGTCDGTTVAASADCVEQVGYAPSTLSTATGMLKVIFTSTGDSSTAEVDVPLSGAGFWPALHVQSTSLKPGYFYPLVRDGYRDWATYSFRLNEAAGGVVQIFNHKGTLTRSYPFSNRDRYAVAWGGRNRLGEKVKPGYYRFRVVAHTHNRRIVSSFRRVQVKTGFRLVTTRGSKHKTGVGWSSRGWQSYQYGGNCNWGHYSGSLITTCLIAHAHVTYTFELPRGAKVTAFSHSVSPGITPCRHTAWAISHTGRIRRATFTHGSLNGFSQCNIDGLSLSWKVTKRIRI